MSLPKDSIIKEFFEAVNIYLAHPKNSEKFFKKIFAKIHDQNTSEVPLSLPLKDFLAICYLCLGETPDNLSGKERLEKGKLLVQEVSKIYKDNQITKLPISFNLMLRQMLQKNLKESLENPRGDFNLSVFKLKVAQAQIRLGNKEKALDILEDVLVDPSCWGRHLKLKVAYKMIKLGEETRGREVFQENLNARENLWDWDYFKESDIYKSLGEKEQAKTTLERYWNEWEQVSVPDWGKLQLAEKFFSLGNHSLAKKLVQQFSQEVKRRIKNEVAEDRNEPWTIERTRNFSFPLSKSYCKDMEMARTLNKLGQRDKALGIIKELLPKCNFREKVKAAEVITEMNLKSWAIDLWEELSKKTSHWDEKKSIFKGLLEVGNYRGAADFFLKCDWLDETNSFNKIEKVIKIAKVIKLDEI